MEDGVHTYDIFKDGVSNKVEQESRKRSGPPAKQPETLSENIRHTRTRLRTDVRDREKRAVGR